MDRKIIQAYFGNSGNICHIREKVFSDLAYTATVICLELNQWSRILLEKLHFNTTLP